MKQPRFFRSHGSGDAEMPAFTYKNRITILPCISAAGDVDSTLFIFKGTQVAYRDKVVDGKIHTETLTSHLSRVR